MSPSSFLPFLLLSLLPSTTAIPASTVTAASEILSNNNHTAFSLTLPLISTLLSLPSISSATFFAPPDTVFSSLSTSPGQPSLSLLKFHFCPLTYTPSDLLSLPYRSHLPTLLPNSSLSVTSTFFDDFVSLNGVKVVVSGSFPPLFHDGFLTVYSVDDFFSPSYRASDDSVSEFSPEPSYPTPDCHVIGSDPGVYSVGSAVLRTRGYSIMAGFLDVQVGQFGDGGDEGRNVITIFAPKDAAIKGYFGNYSDWSSVFLRHVIGCKMSWGDLVGLKDNGGVLGTFLKGFEIKIGKNQEGNLVVKGNLTVDLPNFYRGERVVVHGLSGVLTVPSEDGDSGDQEDSYGGWKSYTPNVVLMASSKHGEF